MKNASARLFSRLQAIEERIFRLEGISIETSTTEKQGEQKLKKKNGTIQELWDNSRRCNIHMIGVPEGEERKKEYLKQ